jgi:hypothetical protein
MIIFLSGMQIKRLSHANQTSPPTPEEGGLVFYLSSWLGDFLAGPPSPRVGVTPIKNPHCASTICDVIF